MTWCWNERNKKVLVLKSELQFQVLFQEGSKENFAKRLHKHFPLLNDSGNVEIASSLPLALRVFLLNQNGEREELKQKRKLKNMYPCERSKNKMSSLGSEKVTTLISAS